ncbi:MAG: hypothetical protein HQL25_00545 [Candidatus Omnitrophica bacterium]|nr:hypothetical protein [Candidatus Omnitrophota bacterium]
MIDILPIFFSIFLAGIVSLLLELSLLREFVYVFGCTAATNAYIISIFLLGLVAGAYLGTFNYLKEWLDKNPRKWFALIQQLSILFILLFFITKKHLIYDIDGKNIVRIYFFICVLTPSLLAGLAYALSVKIMHIRGEKAITYIYAVSTLGSVLGGLAHGMWLVPTWGMTSTYMVAVVCAGLAILFIIPKTHWVWKVLLILQIVLILWVMQIKPFKKWFENKNVVFSQDSQFGIVEVWKLTPKLVTFHNERIFGKSKDIRADETYVDFKINKVHQSYNFLVDRLIHEDWAKSSLAVVKHPAKILLFGYASGVTAAAYLNSPQTEGIYIVENCGPIVEAGKRFFPKEYVKVMRDPRAHMIIDDFRGYLRFTKEKFDIVAIDHSLQDPYSSGFFTVDFFELLKKKMNPDGLVILIGDGLSGKTTRVSFKYIYRNIDPNIQRHVRENCLYMSDQPIGEWAAKDYAVVDRIADNKELVFYDDRVERKKSE